MARHYSPPGTYEAIRKEIIEDPTWTPAEFRLVIWLAAKQDGWVIHPKVLADGTGLSGRAVLAALTGLRRRGLVYDEPVRTPDGRLIDHWETRFRRRLVVAPPPPAGSTPPKNARVDVTSQNESAPARPGKKPQVTSTASLSGGVDPATNPQVTASPPAKPQVTSTEAFIYPLEKRTPIEKTERPIANTDLKPSEPPKPPAAASGDSTGGEPNMQHAEITMPLPLDIPAAALVRANGKTPALGSDQDPGFAAFWAAYPRKTAKGTARRAWAKAITAGADPAALVTAAARYRESPGRKPDYTCHPATWLNQERWEDDPDTVAPGRAAGTNEVIRRGMSLADRFRQAEAVAR